MKQIDELISNGFAIVDDIYTTTEVENMLLQIRLANTNKETFRKSVGLFAIRL